MTPIPLARETLSERGRAALAANHRQALLIHNPSSEVDSAFEFLLLADPLVSGEARRLVRSALNKLIEAHKLNRVEREHEQAICDQAGEVGREWSVKRAAHELRDPLAVLASPIMGGRRREAARAEVERIVRACPRDVLVVGDSIRPSLVNEIRVTKATALWDEICRIGAVA